MVDNNRTRSEQVLSQDPAFCLVKRCLPVEPGRGIEPRTCSLRAVWSRGGLSVQIAVMTSDFAVIHRSAEPRTNGRSHTDRKLDETRARTALGQIANDLFDTEPLAVAPLSSRSATAKREARARRFIVGLSPQRPPEATARLAQSGRTLTRTSVTTPMTRARWR